MTNTDYGQRFKRAATAETSTRPPSAFGRNAAPNTTVYGRITYIGEQPKLKFDGGPGEVELDEHGNPTLQLIITIDTSAGLRNLYPSLRMEQAIGRALDKAGAEFAVGDTLSVTYSGSDPDNTKAKLYTAVYTPVGYGAGPQGTA
ncbi:hypothetical protein OHB26_09555 [Nocardia sp. NBC_01503]|uniref:hypothetical protein n=1 Tax=Nocardia sp. NBC_01503 TaxID=2975997 RepID=UPI002E7AF5DF|nr:hypothetical protein [Nocardia sp. NBC_01503]WTL34421.1 hypothetical protein OHB26_09555 [Nocardia sp. NBC_01503]